jgi:hypothetical protein
LRRQLCVPLRHLQVFVSEDLRKRLELPAAHHVVTRERVPQVVKTEVRDPGIQERFLETAVHVIQRQNFSIPVVAGKYQFFVLYPRAVIRQFVKQDRVDRQASRLAVFRVCQE